MLSMFFFTSGDLAILPAKEFHNNTDHGTTIPHRTTMVVHLPRSKVVPW